MADERLERPVMVRLGARVSLAPDSGAEAYGATLIWFHDGAGREVRRERRGREPELLYIVQSSNWTPVTTWRAASGRPG